MNHQGAKEAPPPHHHHSPGGLSKPSGLGDCVKSILLAFYWLCLETEMRELDKAPLLLKWRQGGHLLL